METQNERLLKYLKEKGQINPMQAWVELGIYRLGARIFDLREAGINIAKTLVEVKNQFGEKCRVALYSLVKNEKA